MAEGAGGSRAADAFALGAQDFCDALGRGLEPMQGRIQADTEFPPTGLAAKILDEEWVSNASGQTVQRATIVFTDRKILLKTQKFMILTERLPFVWGSPPNAFFDGDALRVVWIEYDPPQKRHSIFLYSFETGQATPLDVKLEFPRWVSLAED